MKAIIINRSKDTTRFSFQTEQTELLGVDIERVEAVEASVLGDDVIAKYQSNWQRPLRVTEIACLLSHHKCWSLIAERDEPLLILEDDAVLCNHAGELLESLGNEKKYDLISLEVRRRKKFLSKESKGMVHGYELHDMLYDKGGAAGYIVWPSGARKLLDHMERHGAAPADAFIGDCKGLDRGQVVPAPIIQLDMCEHYRVTQFSSGLSTIFTNIERPSYGSFSNYVKFRLRRAEAQLDLFFRVQIAGLLSPKFKEVEVPIDNNDFVRSTRRVL